MRNDGDIERLLLGMPGPRVVAGSHRDRLRERLINTKLEEHTHMVTWKRVAAVCCIAAALAGSGFAAYEVAVKVFVVEVSEPVTNPDGTVTQSCSAMSSSDPNFTQEKANQMHQEMKQAIAAGHYRLVDVKREDNRPPVYIYEVDLGNGRKVGSGTNEPLPEPAE